MFLSLQAVGEENKPNKPRIQWQQRGMHVKGRTGEWGPGARLDFPERILEESFECSVAVLSHTGHQQTSATGFPTQVVDQ